MTLKYTNFLGHYSALFLAWEQIWGWGCNPLNPTPGSSPVITCYYGNGYSRLLVPGGKPSSTLLKSRLFGPL